MGTESRQANRDGYTKLDAYFRRLIGLPPVPVAWLEGSKQGYYLLSREDKDGVDAITRNLEQGAPLTRFFSKRSRNHGYPDRLWDASGVLHCSLVPRKENRSTSEQLFFWIAFDRQTWQPMLALFLGILTHPQDEGWLFGTGARLLSKLDSFQKKNQHLWSPTQSLEVRAVSDVTPEIDDLEKWTLVNHNITTFSKRGEEFYIVGNRMIGGATSPQLLMLQDKCVLEGIDIYEKIAMARKLPRYRLGELTAPVVFREGDPC